MRGSRSVLPGARADAACGRVSDDVLPVQGEKFGVQPREARGARRIQQEVSVSPEAGEGEAALICGDLGPVAHQSAHSTGLGGRGQRNEVHAGATCAEHVGRYPDCLLNIVELLLALCSVSVKFIEPTADGRQQPRVSLSRGQ